MKLEIYDPNMFLVNSYNDSCNANDYAYEIDYTIIDILDNIDYFINKLNIFYNIIQDEATN